MSENEDNAPQYSGRGRKGFLFSETERQRQYQTYSRYYDELAKYYGDNMTQKYSYKTFVKERTSDLSIAKRLGEQPTSLKHFASEQVLTTYKQAVAQVANARANIKNIIRKAKRSERKWGRKLTNIERVILEETTEEIIDPVTGKKKYVIKDLSVREYRSGKGVLNDLHYKLRVMESHGEIKEYTDEVFGSP